MLPDRWGSDYDYAEAMGTNEPEAEPTLDELDEDAEIDRTVDDDDDLGAACAARCEVTR